MGERTVNVRMILNGRTLNVPFLYTHSEYFSICGAYLITNIKLPLGFLVAHSYFTTKRVYNVSE